MLTVNVVVAGEAHAPFAGGGVPVVVVPPLVVVVVVVTLPVASPFDTVTPAPTRPFMPFAAWPETVQRNSYLPFVLNVTVIVCDLPGASTFVAMPTQAFFDAAVVAVVQTLKL